jgi:hypothetical protein
MGANMTEKAKQVDITELVVRQVAQLVATTAAVLHDSNDEQMELEESLYRALAENCQCKADMTKQLREEHERRKKAGIRPANPTASARADNK